MRVKFCIDSARRADICTGKNNFHNLLRKRHARTGIEQKMSESVPSDSRRTRSPVGFFSIRRVLRNRFASEILISARIGGAQLPHCT
jgi:hypothetical protein